ncbi:M23 family metallopeptidase [Oleomonas cavernae]|uniref:M23 family metallopeptidase n=1 Tax=Oleomonas cavernae TaxID=2320859 RepID=A0A418WDR0_9PROT|nr:M23 family metallopeptidase [Oleomonas cavernae]RJF88163.1 M23 family metallopeptidase [Oleomonas cavernae]
MLVKLFSLGAILFLATPALADTRFEGSFRQGALVIGRTEPAATVRFADRTLRVAPDGRFAFGLGRDFEGDAVLDITLPGGGHETVRQTVAKGEWDVQRIDGLPDKQVTPDEATLARIKEERAQIAAARATDRAAFEWEAGFAWPAKGRISGVYGSQRILNGQPRQPHLGLDVAQPTGTPVHAAVAGVVVLAQKDLYFTGGTIIIDHGTGVQTLYAHLSRVDVKAGDAVTTETVIGAIGATGRVTGPHLHFGVAWYGTQLDPALVLPAQ